MRVAGQVSILLGLVVGIFGIYIAVTGTTLLTSLIVIGVGVVLLLVGGGLWIANPAPQGRAPVTRTTGSAWR